MLNYQRVNTVNCRKSPWKHREIRAVFVVQQLTKDSVTRPRQSPRTPGSLAAARPQGPGIHLHIYPLAMTNSMLLKMAIEIVSFPNKNGDFP
jgi:hypothetical protein